MATIALNTSSLNTNALLSFPSVQSLNKKAASAKKYISYALTPKHSTRKSFAKLFPMDWDLNRNELEFE